MRYLVYFLLFIPIFSFAQLNYGVKLHYGIGLTQQELVRYDDFDDYVIYNVTLTSQALSPGISFQVFFKDKYSNLFLQSELGYRNIKTNFEVKSDIPSDIRTFDQDKSTSYLFVPVVGGLMYNNVKLGFGTNVSIIISESMVFEELLYFEESRPRVEAAIYLMAGWMYEQINFELSYEYFFNGSAEYILHKGLKQGFANAPQFLSLGASIVF